MIGPASSAGEIVAELDSRLRALAALTTAPVRSERRRVSRELRDAPATTVLKVADVLINRDGPADRLIAYELIAAHSGAVTRLNGVDVRRLGRAMDSWGDVDMFACIIAGPAWERGVVSDAEIARWAASSNRWWRRAAVVSTVALNSLRPIGRRGDPRRTFRICRLVRNDRDPMVVKAVSWALRVLAKRAPAAVEEFLNDNAVTLPALVRREVWSKLTTGRKQGPEAKRRVRRLAKER